MLTSSSLAWYRVAPGGSPSELGSPMLRIGYPAAASPSADRGDRHRIGFWRALRIAATGMHDYSWRVAFVLSVARRLRRNRGSRQVRSVPLGGSVAFG
jgi:hypothetical protein